LSMIFPSCDVVYIFEIFSNLFDENFRPLQNVFSVGTCGTNWIIEVWWNELWLLGCIV
jgi:hypothetical protein